MEKLISGWTDRHVAAALGLLVAAAGGAAAVAQPGRQWVVALSAVLATAVLALFFDAFGGLIVGLATAAATVLAQQLAGQWTAENFLTSLALVLALILLGWSAGVVSGRLHRQRRTAGEAEGVDPVTPAYGSLGLLTADVALARADEEVVRARRHDRPLTVLVLRVTLVDESLDAAARTAAHRAVARLLETLLRETDVPFALSDNELGALLTETDFAGAWDVVAPVLEAASRAAFTVRQDDERRRLVDAAELHAGLAVLGRTHPDADSLVAGARAGALDDVAETTPARPAGTAA